MKIKMASSTVLLFLVLLTVGASARADGLPKRKFEIIWPNGTNFIFSYDYKKESECIYDRLGDHLICMRNHQYNYVTSRWSYDPDQIKYISVRCMEQEYFTNHKHTCLCKNGATAANPAQNKHRDEFSYCQINHLYSGLLDKLTNIELIDMSNNLITEIPRTLFHRLKSLRFLNLSNNPLRKLTTGIFCGLEKLKVVLLQKLSLESFPWNIFSCGDSRMLNIEMVDLSNAHISEIPDESFQHIPRLQFLNLTNNLLKTLPPTPFLEASALQYLDLSENFISDISNDFCAGLQALKALRVRGNSFQITNLSPLASCSHLRKIDLSKNRIDNLTTSKQPHLSVEYLDLSDNDLEEITPRMFSKSYPSLKVLDISNNDIGKLHPNAFNGLDELRHLNLSWNRIQAEISRSFSGLSDIQRLDLGNNMLTTVDDHLLKSLSKLKSLQLSNNHISNITLGAFSDLHHLTTMHLENNDIRNLPRDVFQNLTSLRVLNLSRNSIDTIHSYNFPDNLEVLDISFNRITDLPRGLKSVKRLILTGNHLINLPREAFSQMHSLEMLSLNRNRLTNIADHAFLGLTSVLSLDLSENFIHGINGVETFAGLSEVRALDLRKNDISSLGTLFSGDSLGSLIELEMSHNPIGNLTYSLNPMGRSKGLEKLVCRQCRITTTSRDVFTNMSNLLNVDLSSNRITAFEPFISSTKTVFNLLKNPIMCTCNMKWLRERRIQIGGKLVPTRNYRVQTCIAYPKVGEMPITKVPNELFLCKIPKCTDKCRCYSRENDETAETIICSHDELDAVPEHLPVSAKIMYFDGNNFLQAGHLRTIGLRKLEVEEIYLNRSRISGIQGDVFLNMPVLQTVDLSNNIIRDLPTAVFRNLKMLREVYLKSNQITAIAPELFQGLNQLQVIDISSNNILYLETETLHGLSNTPKFRWIHLSNNPWICDCRTKDFRDWIISHRSRIYDRKLVFCGHMEVIRQDDSMFECRQPEWFFVAIGTTVAASCLVLFLVVLGFSIFCFRRSILALGYSRFKISRFHCKEESEVLHPYLYDMVIVYDEMDLKCKWWVNKTLYPRLTEQNWNFRVFVANAKNSSDEAFLHELRHNIHLSQSTLFLISKNFTCSYICMSSFRYARVEAREVDHKILIMAWGEFTREVLDTDVKEYIKKGDYLKVTERFVIDKLICLMPTPYHERKKKQFTNRNNCHERVDLSSSLNNLILNSSIDSLQLQ